MKSASASPIVTQIRLSVKVKDKGNIKEQKLAILFKFTNCHTVLHAKNTVISAIGDPKRIKNAQISVVISLMGMIGGSALGQQK